MALELPKYVINTDNNEIHAYKEGILERPGYRPFLEPLPPIDRKTGLCIKVDKPDPLPSAMRERERQSAESEFLERINLFASEMKKMKKFSFATETGMPSLRELEKKTGFTPTKDERVKAFSIYKEWKDAGGTL